MAMISDDKIPKDLNEQIIELAIKLRLKGFISYNSIFDPAKSYEENLLKLLEEEDYRRWRQRTDKKIRLGGFPLLKTFDDFEMDQKSLPHVNFNELTNLRTCEFIRNREDVLFLGPSGRGKTHLALAIGYEAVKAGYSVIFKKAEQLVIEMTETKGSGRLNDYHKKVVATNLLVLDEIDYGSFTKAEANLLFRVIAERNEIASTVITSNYDLPKWRELIEDEMLVRGLVDRIINHSIIFNMNGPTG